MQIWPSFFALIFRIIHAEDCISPENTAGLIIESGTQNLNSKVTSNPLHVCDCNIGKKFFYASTSFPIPYEAFEYKSLAYYISGFYHQCNDICVCSIDGICYTQTSYYAEVYLVPYCEKDECYIYAGVEIQSDLNTPLISEHTVVYRGPNPANTSVGLDTQYLKVASISCFGCKNIRKAQCYKQMEKECTPPAYSAGLIVDPGTISAFIDRTSIPIATCQTTGTLKYFYSASEQAIPFMAFTNRTEAFTIDSLGICPYLCIRAEDGQFYVPISKNFYVEFVPFCDAEGCSMYAVNYETRGQIKVKDGPVFHNPDPFKIPVGSNTTYIKVDAVSCFGCAHVKNEVAYGPTILSDDKQFYTYPTLTYTENNQDHLVINVLDESTITDVPGNTYDTIVFFCELAYGKSAWKQSEANYVTVLLQRNGSTLTDFCVLANMEKYKSLCGSQSLDNLLEIESYTLSERKDNFILITIVSFLLSKSFYVNLFSFGLLGQVFCCMVIYLMIATNPSLLSFHIFCIAQATNDMVLLVNNTFIEGYRNLKFFITGNDLASISGYNLDYIMFFINQCSCLICSILIVLMSFNRFIALYFPFQYDKLFSNKKTLAIILFFVFIFIIVDLPLVVIPKKCKSEYVGYYMAYVGCGSTYIFIQVYADFGAIFICLVFDVLTAIKLHKFIKQQSLYDDQLSKKRTVQEKLFFTQNITKFITFGLFLIPFVYIEYIDRVWPLYADNWVFRIINTLYLYNCFRTFWRCLDQILVFSIQYRLFKINTSVQTSSVQAKKFASKN